MIQYIYFVKCPNCEDEHFDFFDEAKEFALGCLSQKPIITQTEVNRNDFGECTDHCDLGTVWSWEDVCTPEKSEGSVFSKAETVDCPECDAEFDNIDNSVDFEIDKIPDNFRKPVPADMTIDQLKEEMEENEDTVECAGCEELFPKDECVHKDGIGWLCDDCEDRIVKCSWCEELYDKSECRYEVDLGWLCDRCEAAIKSRGETLTFREGSYWDFLDEGVEQTAFDPAEPVDIEYTDLVVTLQSPKYAADDWDEETFTTDYTLTVEAGDVATVMWENDMLTDKDVADVPGGFDTLEDDSAWQSFLNKHFDELFEKNYDKIREYYRERAASEYSENTSWSDHKANRKADHADSVVHSMLETLEEPEEYNKRLTPCPECGSKTYDHETSFCINCGFN